MRFLPVQTSYQHLLINRIKIYFYPNFFVQAAQITIYSFANI